MNDTPRDIPGFKRPVIVTVPKEFIDLQVELDTHHRELQAEMKMFCDTFEDCIAHMATKFNIMLHGEYTGADLKNIVVLITKRLVASRSLIIINDATDDNTQRIIH